MLAMEEKLKGELTHLSLSQLYEIENFLEELIENGEAEAATQSDTEGRKNRREVRIDTKIRAKVRRVTDVKPGQITEFQARITDISRHGMSISISGEFIPSRIILVSFCGPKGNIKENYLEIVRVNKIENGQDITHELGCRCIADDAVRQLRQQEGKNADKLLKTDKDESILFLVGVPNDNK